MPDHIIVMFDRSGSMRGSFQADSRRASSAEDIGQYETKILAAQERLIMWLKKAQFEIVTVIPFHSVVETSLTASLHDEWHKIESFVRSQQAGGGTSLSSALAVAIEIGAKEPVDAYVQYLIVTDGLSDTMNEDLELVEQIPRRQGVSGILIDPTEQGENHLRRLCVRGSYSSVASSRQLTQDLAAREEAYSARIELKRAYQGVMIENRRALEHLERYSQRLNSHPSLNQKLGQLVSRAVSEARQIEEHRNAINEKIADQGIPISLLMDERQKLVQQQEKIGVVVNLLEACYQSSPRLDISLAHPKFLSKRFTAPFIVRLYPPNKRNEVLIELKHDLHEWGLTEKIYSSDLVSGLAVTVKLTSQKITFSDAVAKKLENTVNTISFTAKPDDDCHPGPHSILLSITDKETSFEYESIALKVHVKDFAFDHISRPFLSNITSIVLGLGSLTTFILTSLGQIDATFGVASGTVAGGLAAFIYNRFQMIYSRPNTIINKP